MTEEIIIMTVGKSNTNAWRRDNLLKLRHCVDKTSHFEVMFQWVDHTGRFPKQVKLTYNIVK